jgi:hypothetical protein
MARAKGDASRALAIARDIADPWFKCQALAGVAEHTLSAAVRRRLIHECLRAAAETREPNRIVTVSAWPLRLLYMDRDWDSLRAEIDRLLAVIAKEPHPTRRNDALFWLWHRIRPEPVGPFLKVLAAFREACAAGHGWKRDRNLQSMSLYLKHVLPGESAT